MQRSVHTHRCTRPLTCPHKGREVDTHGTHTKRIYLHTQMLISSVHTHTCIHTHTCKKTEKHSQTRTHAHTYLITRTQRNAHTHTHLSIEPSAREMLWGRPIRHASSVSLRTAASMSLRDTYTDQGRFEGRDESMHGTAATSLHSTCVWNVVTGEVCVVTGGSWHALDPRSWVLKPQVWGDYQTSIAPVWHTPGEGTQRGSAWAQACALHKACARGPNQQAQTLPRGVHFGTPSVRPLTTTLLCTMPSCLRNSAPAKACTYAPH